MWILMAQLLTNLSHSQAFLPCMYICTRTDWLEEEQLRLDPTDYERD
jgi:hypothetical protein